jgi:GntR family transcriptional repressor for pyruvate dehydrogenase complex
VLTPVTSTRSSLSAEIIRSLTEYIFSGQLNAGEKLPSERQLSESLGVTRSAVRDAIQSLGLLGVVDIRQGDGTYLRGATESMLPQVIEWGLFLGERRLMDLVEARQQIEIALAGFAAKRRTPEQLEQIRAALGRMSDAAISPAEFVEADIAFHFSIAEASGNSALADVLSSITGLLRAWMARSIKAAGETRSSHSEHLEVFAAIESGNARAAKSAMSRHMSHAEKRLRTTLGESPDALWGRSPAIDVKES